MTPFSLKVSTSSSFTKFKTSSSELITIILSTDPFKTPITSFNMDFNKFSRSNGVNFGDNLVFASVNFDTGITANVFSILVTPESDFFFT